MNVGKIYRIINNANNRTYIGFTTQSIESRFTRHKILLRKNTHTCKRMQEDFTFFGESNFSIELVEFIYNEKECREIEDYWMSFKDDGFHAFYNKNENGTFRKSTISPHSLWNLHNNEARHE